jgi:diphosphomevalonate decarboxylase
MLKDDLRKRMKTWTNWLLFLKVGIWRIIKVVESEALTTCDDDDFDALFHFNETDTLQIINAIWKFRNETKIPVCYTLMPEQMSTFCIENVSKKSFAIY